MRRSISDIVAVVLLIVIAIAAAVIIYMWLSGIIGTLHGPSSVSQQVKVLSANVSSGKVYAVVFVPQGSTPVTITALDVENVGGSVMYCTASVNVTVLPGTQTPVEGPCTLPSNIPPGTPVEVVVVTPYGPAGSAQAIVG